MTGQWFSTRSSSYSSEPLFTKFRSWNMHSRDTIHQQGIFSRKSLQTNTLSSKSQNPQPLLRKLGKQIYLILKRSILPWM